MVAVSVQRAASDVTSRTGYHGAQHSEDRGESVTPSTNGDVPTTRKFQLQLLQQARATSRETPLSAATERAYLETPRHLFVSKYRQWGSPNWHDIGLENVNEHAAALYADQPLILAGDDDQHLISTISQPSFVLRMLDLLQLEPGHCVFELGAGSGWNAALLGYLVGTNGRVISVEIVPEVAAMAMAAVDAINRPQVRIVVGDGGEGFSDAGPYDRAIFTAGTYDVPQAFFTQVKDGGLLLTVVKNVGGGDNLFVLRKTAGHFESIDSMNCGFVQLAGKYRDESLDPLQLDAHPEWPALQDREVLRQPFWWGGAGKQSFMWRTAAVRSFLGITEPRFLAFKEFSQGREEPFFGLWDREENSLVVARDDKLIAYGTETALCQLRRGVERWARLGMPTAASFQLSVYPNDVPVTVGEGQWLVRRRQSQFVWTLTP
jgi:protein-L-isoaspartate(D-aspartate) O-methyltransferase